MLIFGNGCCFGEVAKDMQKQTSSETAPAAALKENGFRFRLCSRMRLEFGLLHFG